MKIEYIERRLKDQFGSLREFLNNNRTENSKDLQFKASVTRLLDQEFPNKVVKIDRSDLSKFSKNPGVEALRDFSKKVLNLKESAKRINSEISLKFAELPALDKICQFINGLACFNTENPEKIIYPLTVHEEVYLFKTIWNEMEADHKTDDAGAESLLNSEFDQFFKNKGCNAKPNRTAEDLRNYSGLLNRAKMISLEIKKIIDVINSLISDGADLLFNINDQNGLCFTISSQDSKLLEDLSKTYNSNEYEISISKNMATQGIGGYKTFTFLPKNTNTKEKLHARAKRQRTTTQGIQVMPRIGSRRARGK